LIHRALPWIQAHLSWPGGILGIAVTLALFGAALTEWIGIHAIFGAFIVGVAFGDSSHLRQRTRSVIEQFIGSIFAPIFFASIGLRVDFFANFDLILVVVVLAVACIGETLGCAIGAMWAGFPRRQSWAIGFALNARGAMEIVLATLALQYGVIGERLFVALVIMALVTSIVAGPLMQRVLKRRVGAKVRDYLRPQTFVSDLRATLPKEAIEELSELAAKSDSFAADELAAAAWERERAMSTAFPGGIAIPHAQIQGLQVPIIAVGISNRGLEFDSPDGAPTRLVILVFAGPEHSQQHLELLADIARIFRTGEAVSAACEAKSFTEFLATMNILVSEHGAH
jgi:mannitol/fructose-specific phosphotransferase system IIA component (Ntr-type)